MNVCVSGMMCVLDARSAGYRALQRSANVTATDVSPCKGPAVCKAPINVYLGWKLTSCCSYFDLLSNLAIAMRMTILPHALEQLSMYSMCARSGREIAWSLSASTRFWMSSQQTGLGETN
jgi:hypothetical protein